MTPKELIAEAARLASEAVVNDWGGPFGALIARDGEIIARGQNRVLLTGDVTAHAEIEAIRKAIQIVNPYAPSIGRDHQDESTLQMVDTGQGDADTGRSRAQMLQGFVLYSSGEPCPMCMGAIYWARLDACYYGCDVEEARQIGFDDAWVYEEFRRPTTQRRLTMKQLFPELCAEPYRLWVNKADRHYY